MKDAMTPILEPIFLQEEDLGSLVSAKSLHGRRICELLDMLRRSIPAVVAGEPPIFGLGIEIFCGYSDDPPGPVIRMVEVDLPLPYDPREMMQPSFVADTTFLYEAHLYFSPVGRVAIAENGATMLLDLIIDGPDGPYALIIMLIDDVLVYQRSSVERCEGCGGLHSTGHDDHDIDPERAIFDEIISTSFDVGGGTDAGMVGLTYVSEEAASLLVSYVNWMLNRSGDLRSRFLA